MRAPLRFSHQSAHLILPTSVLTRTSGPGLAPYLGLRVFPTFRPQTSVPSLATPRRFSTRGRLLGQRHPQQPAVITKSEGIYHLAQARHPYSQPLTASVSGIFVVLAGVLALSAYYALHPRESVSPSAEDLTELTGDMTADTAPGRPGTLTPEQEEKLKRLWQLIFQVCAVGQEQNSVAAPAEKAQGEEDVKKEKKSRMGFFSRKSKKDEEDSSGAPPNASIVLNLKDGEADKYGQTKHFYDTLASQSAESIRDTIWSMVKHDHPDALILRFLRARKWDPERALIMFVSTMNWRAQEMKVDEDIMRNGEAAALAAETSSDPVAQKLGRDFMAQIRKGISYVHGHDKQGRPLCFVNVRLHKQGEQAEEALERYTVYLIETCRMVLQPPVDTATIVFDMTGFSMANMDYTPVKFMIKCFEANYPECLGTVLVHKAPWIFQGIWKVIRGWLDPVVANKVHFTNSAKEMEEFIPIKHIPKDLDGDEDWTYQYAEPVAGENAALGDVATRDRLLAARALLYKEYEDATLEWIRVGNDAEKAAQIKARRNGIAERLREGYWEVDPYLRARSYYDRIGVLLPGGKLDWYPEAKPVNGSVAAPVVVAETSADDID